MATNNGNGCRRQDPGEEGLGAAWGVLETWMLQQGDEDPMLGQTMIDPDAWHETFAHRFATAA